MISELRELLSNSYSPYDIKCFAAIVLMKDGTKFKGVTLKMQFIEMEYMQNRLQLLKL